MVAKAAALQQFCAKAAVDWSLVSPERKSIRQNSSFRTLDDDKVAVGIFLTQGSRGLIFRTAITSDRRGTVLEFDYDIPLARGAFHALVGAATNDELRAIFFESRLSGSQVFGISLLIANRYPNNPIAFCHYTLLAH